MIRINAEIAARDLHTSDSLPVDVEAICAKQKIRIRHTKLGPYRAFYMEHRGLIIAVNKDLPLAEQRYGISRELAHHIFNHVPLIIRDKKPVARPEGEIELAKFFAMELLMPKILLYKYGQLTPKKIAEVCVVPVCVAAVKAGLFGWK